MVTGLAVGAVASWLVALPAAVANADCTGSDFGAGSGCPPPDDSSGSGGGESWPPTAVDWPPSQSSESGGKGGDKGAATPIVMPDGQPTPVEPPASGSDSDASTTPPTPIVPAGAVSTDPVPTVIVTPTTSSP